MAAQPYTNGSGRCPTGVENATRIASIKERVDIMEGKLETLDHDMQTRCKNIEDAVAKLDKDNLTARLSTSSTILVAIIAGLFSLAGSFIAAYAASR